MRVRLLNNSGTLSQGWQVSAKGGLNRGLIRFKPSWQKQVSDSFGQKNLFSAIACFMEASLMTMNIELKFVTLNIHSV